MQRANGGNSVPLFRRAGRRFSAKRLQHDRLADDVKERWAPYLKLDKMSHRLCVF